MKRKSFIFYDSFLQAIEKLPLEDQKNFIFSIIKYGIKGENFPLKSELKPLFILIKPQLDANNRKYLNGLKGAPFGHLGGRPIKPQGNPSGVITNNPKETPNDNDNDNDNVKENVNENENGKPNFFASQISQLKNKEDWEKMLKDTDLLGINLTYRDYLNELASLGTWVISTANKSNYTNAKATLKSWVLRGLTSKPRKYKILSGLDLAIFKSQNGLEDEQ